jgi:hypothetical protein
MKGFPQFPQASTLATPFHDPIADSIDEYQAFLKTLVYSPIAKAAFGKRAAATSAKSCQQAIELYVVVS